jgi:hypothetical protein
MTDDDLYFYFRGTDDDLPESTDAGGEEKADCDRVLATGYPDPPFTTD